MLKSFLFKALSGRALPVAAAALLLLPHPGAAEDRDARLEAARAYVEVTLQDMDMDELVRGMYRPLLQQIRAQGQSVSAEQEAEIEALYLEHLRAPMADIMHGQDTVMADMLSLAEIEALLAFYSTDEGRRVMMVLPQMMEAQLPMIMGMVEERMEIILPELLRILEQ